MRRDIQASSSTCNLLHHHPSQLLAQGCWLSDCCSSMLKHLQLKAGVLGLIFNNCQLFTLFHFHLIASNHFSPKAKFSRSTLHFTNQFLQHLLSSRKVAFDSGQFWLTIKGHHSYIVFSSILDVRQHLDGAWIHDLLWWSSKIKDGLDLTLYDIWQYTK